MYFGTYVCVMLYFLAKYNLYVMNAWYKFYVSHAKIDMQVLKIQNEKKTDEMLTDSQDRRKVWKSVRASSNPNLLKRYIFLLYLQNLGGQSPPCFLIPTALLRRC